MILVILLHAVDTGDLPATGVAGTMVADKFEGLVGVVLVGAGDVWVVGHLL